LTQEAYLAVETGGTKIVCRLTDVDGRVLTDVRLPTGRPEDALVALIGAVHQPTLSDVRIAGIGLASFGPVVVDPAAPDFGMIRETPKPGWSGFNLGRALSRALEAPVAIDTDVNAAALAEQALGAGRGFDAVAYVTVGTGVGGGLALAGRALRGGLHPEIGHIRIRRRPDDRQPSACPFHDDCVEGLTAGPALGLRLAGRSLEEASEVRDLVVDYLGQLCAILLLAWSPQRVVMGGGVMSVGGLIPEIERRIRADLNGYGALWVAEADGYLAPAELEHAGLEGALLMARHAAAG